MHDKRMKINLLTEIRDQSPLCSVKATDNLSAPLNFAHQAICRSPRAFTMGVVPGERLLRLSFPRFFV